MKRPDFSVSQRLALGSVIVAALIALLGWIVASSVSRVTILQREQTSVIAPRARAAEELEAAIYREAVALRNFAISRSTADLDAFHRSALEVEQRMETLARRPKRAEGEELFAEIVSLLARHDDAVTSFLTGVQAGLDPAALGHAEERAGEVRATMLQKVRSYAELQGVQTREATEEIGRATERLSRTVVVVTLLILSVSILTASVVARSVRHPARRLAAAADAMRRGEFGPALALEEKEREERFRDELREAGHLFGRMAATLKAREERLAAHSRLSAALAASLDPRALATEALREVTAYAGAEIGVVYLADGEGRLQPVTSIALAGQVAPVAVGEGIPGQVAAERRTRVIGDIPADTPWLVKFGFDAVPPRCVAASPMVVENRLVGVIVAGALRSLDDDAILFIDQAARQLAITLDNALAHDRISALAAELQDRNETLQLQNEELQAQSEELQAQSEELQAQSEELQAQSEELQAQNEELQVQTTELQLQSDELRNSKETLARRNEELAKAEGQKNRFLAVLGHELRNPLAAINGAISLLGEAEPNDHDVVRMAHELIRRQTAHFGRLLDDLLDVARITSGKILLNRRPLDLGELVERAVWSVANDTNSGPEVRVEVDGPVWIDADETRIEQIVMNLVTNALKYTPPQGTIRVRAERDQEGAVLTVADSGSGIEPDLLPRVFDFFVQGNDRPERSQGGLGVGLTLVRHLVEMHGGKVEAISDGAGRGTTLIVRIPSLAGPPVVLPPTAQESRLQIRRSIVVIEDNSDVREMMRHVLKRAGHTVAEAHDGPSGVAAVVERKPDVALVDIDLPGFDGCEVARRVRRDPQLANVCLIAVSGYGRPEDRERALAAGFDEHFVKPVDFGRLHGAMLDLPRKR